MIETRKTDNETILKDQGGYQRVLIMDQVYSSLIKQPVWDAFLDLPGAVDELAEYLGPMSDNDIPVIQVVRPIIELLSKQKLEMNHIGSTNLLKYIKFYASLGSPYNQLGN